MKTYFAKLAARATLPNTSASPAVARDPFEDAAASSSQSPSWDVDGVNRSTNETGDSSSLRSSTASARPEHVQPTSKLSTSPSLEPLDHSTTLVPGPPPVLSPPEHPVHKTPGTVAAEGRPQATEPERLPAELVPRMEMALPPIQPVSLPSTETAPRSSDDVDQSLFAVTENTEEKLAEIQREQGRLLRKADAFMEQVFSHRSQSATKAEGDSHFDDESRSTLKPHVKPDQTPRLLPVQAAPQTLEHDSDRPSLVIGKLTIEVVPPPPAPVTPPQKVVVVRGARGGRNGIPSSRRFGLGQF